MRFSDRFDRGSLASPVRRANGSVIYTGRVARTGPHEYPGRIERRDADELRRIADQLVGTPLTLRHPQTLLSAGGKGKVIGRVDRAWIEGDHAYAELRVDDADAASAIERGVRELSLGYRVDMDGEWQRQTVVDHVAFVEAARCGSTCSVRVDCACGCTPEIQPIRKTPFADVQIARRALAC